MLIATAHCGSYNGNPFINVWELEYSVYKLLLFFFLTNCSIKESLKLIMRNSMLMEGKTQYQLSDKFP